MIGVLLLFGFLGLMGLSLFLMKKFFDKTHSELENKDEMVITQLPEKKKRVYKKRVKKV
jgi:hypothetical protein